jgi:hypothetical protein
VTCSRRSSTSLRSSASRLRSSRTGTVLAIANSVHGCVHAAMERCHTLHDNPRYRALWKVGRCREELLGVADGKSCASGVGSSWAGSTGIGTACVASEAVARRSAGRQAGRRSRHMGANLCEPFLRRVARGCSLSGGGVAGGAASLGGVVMKCPRACCGAVEGCSLSRSGETAVVPLLAGLAAQHRHRGRYGRRGRRGETALWEMTRFRGVELIRAAVISGSGNHSTAPIAASREQEDVSGRQRSFSKRANVGGAPASDSEGANERGAGRHRRRPGAMNQSSGATYPQPVSEAIAVGKRV